MNNKSTKEESPLKSVLSVLGTDMFLFPFAVIIGALVTRYLGPANKGIYSFIILIYGIFPSIIMLGNTGSVRYYLSKKEYEVKEIFGSVLLMIFYFSVVACSLIYSLWYFGALGETGSKITPRQMAYILITIPIVIANLLFVRFLVGTSKFILKNKILITYRIAQLIIIATAALILDLGLTGVIVAVMIAHIINLFLYTRTISNVFDLRFHLDFNFIKKAHTYGIQLWLNELVRISNKRIDQLIIGIMLAPELLGFFAISVTVSELTQKIPGSVVQVFFNQIAKADDERRKALLERVHKLVFWTTFAGAAFLIFFGYWLIVLMYGNEFKYSYTILLFYLPGVVVYMSTRIFLQYFAAIGLPLKNALIQAIGLLVGIPLYIILINRIGVIGAAIASSAAYLTTNIVAMYLYNRHGHPVSLDMYLMKKDDWQWVGNKYNQVTSKIKAKLKQ